MTLTCLSTFYKDGILFKQGYDYKAEYYNFLQTYYIYIGYAEYMKISKEMVENYFI